eukprot:1887436-Prymnesium_polylepis.1
MPAGRARVSDGMRAEVRKCRSAWPWAALRVPLNFVRTGRVANPRAGGALLRWSDALRWPPDAARGPIHDLALRPADA